MPARVPPIPLSHGQTAGVARCVLLDGEQRRHALAVLVFPTHGVTGALGRDHHHVHIGGGLIGSKRMLKPWAKLSTLPPLRWGAISFS